VSIAYASATIEAFDCDADVLGRLTPAFTGIYAGFLDDLRAHLARGEP
jgi:hypothetical protein